MDHLFSAFSPTQQQLEVSTKLAGSLMSEDHQELMYSHLARLVIETKTEHVLCLRYAAPVQVFKDGHYYNSPIQLGTRKLAVCAWFFDLPADFQYSFLTGTLAFTGLE